MSARALRFIVVCGLVAVGGALAATIAFASSSKGVGSGSSSAVPSGVTVFAGPPPPQVIKPPRGISKHADVLAFFPRAVTITAGQSVTFQFDGFHTATLNWQSFSQITFAFVVTPQLLVQGIVWATLIGLCGGLFPAVRAARLPIAAALREL